MCYSSGFVGIVFSASPATTDLILATSLRENLGTGDGAWWMGGGGGVIIATVGGGGGINIYRYTMGTGAGVGRRASVMAASHVRGCPSPPLLTCGEGVARLVCGDGDGRRSKCSMTSHFCFISSTCLETRGSRTDTITSSRPPSVFFPSISCRQQRGNSRLVNGNAVLIFRLII